MTTTSGSKVYLGDAVYCQPWWDGGVKLTTENGIDVTNTVILEVDTLQALIDYVKAQNERHKAPLREESRHTT